MADFQWALQQINRGKKVCRKSWITPTNPQWKYWDLQLISSDASVQMVHLLANDWELYTQSLYDWWWAVEMLESGKQIRWSDWPKDRFLKKYGDAYYTNCINYGHLMPLETISKYFLESKWEKSTKIIKDL